MFPSVLHLLFNSIEKFPNNVVFRYFSNHQWQEMTYYQLGENIKNLTHGLLATGLKFGDRIAILSDNQPEWPITDFAIFGLRGITVPIYQTLTPPQIAYILKDAGVRAIFVQDAQQYEKIAEIREKVPSLEFVFSYHKLNGVLHFDDLINKGKEHRAQNPKLFDESLAAIDPEETCSLVYTSGTTGEPKGVMLCHRGFVTDIVNAEAVLKLRADDVFLSFLPLSHLYERLAGHWCPMYRGATIHYARGLDTVIEDIAVARPTVMVSVPRLYEKIANAMQEKAESGSALVRNIFYWAIGTGLEYHEKRRKGQVGKWLQRRYRLAEKLVFNKVKQKLGGRFRYPIAGGAPLSVDTLKIFEAIGLPIIEGYGMTETHLILTLTPPGQVRYGSCGKAIKDVELRIAEDGEVLVRGPILMKGYYNKPEMTREVIDEQGWLHTGDIGYLDEDGYLFLTDRKKNIIVTSGGKNVAPAPIEHKLKTSKFIDEVCLVGNNRKFVSALIVPAYEMLKDWAEKQKIKFSSTEELLNHPETQKLFQNEIDRLQEGFARYEKVKKFVLLPEPFSQERGELTPSLKIKRNVVEKNYKHLIDQLYAD